MNFIITRTSLVQFYEIAHNDIIMYTNNLIEHRQYSDLQQIIHRAMKAHNIHVWNRAHTHMNVRA